MKVDIGKASILALATALVGLALGAACLGLGLDGGVLALWGVGGACLLQVAPALSLRTRLRDGLGNSGLDRERLTLKITSHLQRLLALGMAMAAISALLGERFAPPAPITLGLALLVVLLTWGLWRAKRGLSGFHPALDQDATRMRVLLESAGMLLLGQLLGRWFPWGDAAGALAIALRLFVSGHALARATTLEAAACGGCGGGCGCG
jgi:hypothetical protein